MQRIDVDVFTSVVPLGHIGEWMQSFTPFKWKSDAKKPCIPMRFPWEPAYHTFARVHPSRGVKQGCPLSFLLFSLYVNDVNEIAEVLLLACLVLCDAHALC